MTPHEAFAEAGWWNAGRAPGSRRPRLPRPTSAARLFLVDLLAFAGRLDDALTHPRPSSTPTTRRGPGSAGRSAGLLKAERRRSVRVRRPVILHGADPASREAPVAGGERRSATAGRRTRCGGPTRPDGGDAGGGRVSGRAGVRRPSGRGRAVSARCWRRSSAAITCGFPWEAVRRVKLGPRGTPWTSAIPSRPRCCCGTGPSTRST